MSKLYRNWFHSLPMSKQEKIMKQRFVPEPQEFQPLPEFCEVDGCKNKPVDGDFICWDHISKMVTDMAEEK